MKLKIVVLLSIVSLLAFAASRYSGAGNNCHITHERLATNGFWVDVDYYGKSSSSLKNMIIMPPTGGINFIDESYARMFCSSGYQVFILKQWLGQDEESFELTLHQRFYERSAKAIDLVVGKIKTGSIGIIGTSVGALHTAVVLSLQDRINAAFLIVGGAPLAEVIVQSDQEAMQNLAKTRKILYAFKNDDEYLKALSEELKLEPMKLGDGYKNKKIAMLVSLTDTTVPASLQKKLADYFKPALLIEVDQSHFWAIVYGWLFKSDLILNFFEAEFNI